MTPGLRSRRLINGFTIPAKGKAMSNTDIKATLSFSDGSPSVDFPIYKGSIGPDVIDIRKLYGATGKFTYDPGFMSTASCNSSITYIDGDKGELLYRGYPIEQLAVNCDFLESCYLLLHGELPNATQKEEFVKTVTQHTMVHEQMNFFFRGFRRDAHPMAVLTGSVGALSAFYHDSLDISNANHREVSAIRMIAKLPTLVAMAYKYSIGQPFVYPRNDLSYTANFMRMMFANPCEEYQVNEVLVRALDRILILHADHEQNASTSTVRLAGSSGANPFACIAAGIACLWGPAHGGANEAALNMLEQIGSVENIPEFIKQEGQELRREADGLRSPRLQELRPACQADARNLLRSPERTGPARRPAVQAGHGAGKDRPGRRLLRLPQAVPERRLLLRHRAARPGHPDLDVHLHLRHGPYHRLDRPVERNDFGSGTEDRPSASAVRGLAASRRHPDRQALIGGCCPSALSDGQQRHRQRRVSRLPGVFGGGQRGPRSKALRAGVGGRKCPLLHVSNKKANPLGFAFLFDIRRYNSDALTG